MSPSMLIWHEGEYFSSDNFLKYFVIFISWIYHYLLNWEGTLSFQFHVKNKQHDNTDILFSTWNPIVKRIKNIALSFFNLENSFALYSSSHIYCYVPLPKAINWRAFSKMCSFLCSLVMQCLNIFFRNKRRYPSNRFPSTMVNNLEIIARATWTHHWNAASVWN